MSDTDRGVLLFRQASVCPKVRRYESAVPARGVVARADDRDDMNDARDTGLVAECFWTGVTDDDLRALDERVGVAVASLTSQGERVRYLGSILMRADELVLCLFEGSAAAVEKAARSAEIPFERIVESTNHLGTAAHTRADSAATARPHQRVEVKEA